MRAAGEQWRQIQQMKQSNAEMARQIQEQWERFAQASRGPQRAGTVLAATAKARPARRKDFRPALRADALKRGPASLCTPRFQAVAIKAFL
jgi:hypothetical protein